MAVAEGSEAVVDVLINTQRILSEQVNTIHTVRSIDILLQSY